MTDAAIRTLLDQHRLTSYWIERQPSHATEQAIVAALHDYAEYSRHRDMEEKGLDDAALAIRAEQLTTAYELAKDEGLQGDELNAVVVRHLDETAWAVFRMFMDALMNYLYETSQQEAKS